jgi:hypothetical protein
MSLSSTLVPRSVFWHSGNKSPRRCVRKCARANDHSSVIGLALLKTKGNGSKNPKESEYAKSFRLSGL